MSMDTMVQQAEPHSEEIHSGHYMVSSLREGDCGDEEEVQTSEIENTVTGYDFTNAAQEPYQTYQFGDRSTIQLAIDASLNKLFECMTLAYSGKLTSPKWKNFKGIRVPLKDKIRLNNIIWREWHMQYIQGKHPIICQFEPPISDKVHSKPEAVVLEGKYWKRRLESVTAEYKKWRMFCQQRNRKESRDDSFIDLALQLDRYDSHSFARSKMPQSVLCDQYSDDDMDSKQFMDLTDTLFTTIPNINQPLIFPNPRELSQLGNADIIQPGLVQLQPSLDDIMDTLEPLTSLSDMILPNYRHGTFMLPNLQNVSPIRPSPTPMDMSDLLNMGMNQHLSTTNVGSPVNVCSVSVPPTGKQAQTIEGVTGLIDQQSPAITNLDASTMSTLAALLNATNATVLQDKKPFANQSQITLVLNSNVLAGATTTTVQVTDNKPVVEQIPVAQPQKIQPAAPQTISSVEQLRAEKNKSTRQTNAFLAQLLTSVIPLPVKQEACASEEIPTPILPAVKPIAVKQEKCASLSNFKPIQPAPAPVHSRMDLSTSPAGFTLGPKMIGDFPKHLLSEAVMKVMGTTSVHIPQAVMTTATHTITSESDPTSPLFNPGSPPFNHSTSPSEFENRSRHASRESTGSGNDTFVKPRPPKYEPERGQYKDMRRASHITSEQRRRGHIKIGFEMLHQLVPSLKMSSSSKTSIANTLGKTSEYIRKLKHERKQMQEEADILKQEVESLNNAISACQLQLPATGVPVTRQRSDRMRDIFDNYVKNRTLQNWKFWIFSIIIRPLLESYNKSVSTANMDEMCRTVLSWLEQHCSLVALRPMVSSSLLQLSTKTSILSDPSKVPEQAAQVVSSNSVSEASGGLSS